MSWSGRMDDVAALLYLVPFFASSLYAIYLWVQVGFSAILPSSVYLSVTRDPILFILGSFSVMLGLILEVTSGDKPGRQARLAKAGNTLQNIAAASLILVLISALYANGLDLSGAATDFIVGRYGLVFPAMLVLLSYLVTARFRLGSLMNLKILGILAMLLVPVSLYELGRRQTVLGLSVALVFLVAGAALLLLPVRKKETPKEG